MDDVVSDEHLVIIAEQLINTWESLLIHVGMKPVQETEIKRSCSGGYREQKCAFLVEWRRMKGGKATYHSLIAGAEKARNMRLADAVRDLVQKESTCNVKG